MTQYFSVKDFTSFQHYKDRTPPWIKLYNSTLDDYEISNLPDASKAHLFAIWLLASRYDNKIPYDAEWVARRINATAKVDLDILVKSGKIILDQDCSNVLAPCKQNAIPEREAEREAEKRREECFYLFWEQFPRQRRGNKAKAKSAYLRALKEKRATESEIADGLTRYVNSSEVAGGFAKGAEAWLNDDRWGHDYTPPRQTGGGPSNDINAAFEREAPRIRGNG